MAKKSKLATPDWIKEGYESKSDWEKANGIETKKKSKEKTFKIRVCPECDGDVEIVLSNLDFEEESNTGKEWKCIKCDWKGSDVGEKQLSEDEFMKYLDEKGEEVA
jgi:hypothetical protein